MLQEPQSNQWPRLHYIKMVSCFPTCLLPSTKTLIGQVETSGNWYVPTPPQTIFDVEPQKATPWTSFFCPEAFVNKPNQVKPTLLSLLFGLDSVGVLAMSVVPFDPI
jgi:hypothetical protein